MRGARFLAAALCASAVLLVWGCAQAATDEAGPRPLASADLDAAARAHPVTFLNRLGWGADSSQLAELQRVGATRLLDQQLRAPSSSAAPDVPEPIARSLADLAAQVPSGDALGAWFAEQRRMRKQARQLGGDEAQAKLRALQQQDAAITRAAMQQQLLLDVYARDQLRQRLTWFWMNHFNVFRGGLLGPMMGDYVQRVIAPHSLGSFRELLRATMFSPQMVIYLNNARNARGHINENYAREVMELHTLGVGGGYTQADVTHLAHVLTGLGIDAGEQPFGMRGGFRGRVWRDGMVVFRPARHDPESQLVLGRELQGRNVDEIEQVVTLLADDPATARHVSFELAQYFVADHPDPAMVDAMVRTWGRSHGDIAAVLRTMFTSPAFIASLAQPQFKDPMRYVISAVRCSAEGRVIRNPQPLLGMLGRLGEPLYGRSTPDGYPIGGGAWDSPGQLTTRFEIAQQLGAGSPVLFEPAPSGPPGMGGAGAPSLRPPARVPRLSSGAVYLAAKPSLRPATVEVLAGADRPVRWNALWLASPDFMNQ